MPNSDAPNPGADALLDRLGVVVIGRNEGERLKASLASLTHVPHRVYVDSGSTDGSQAAAAALGFEVVELPVPPKFTAARARNAGLARLLEREPALEWVQMVDGDCEVAGGWIDAAAETLRGDGGLAAVFGRRRERFPGASAYNMMCDDEWNVPVGEANSCGGDALFRVAALQHASGYNPDLIAGEEPDLCLRMRQKGWRIRRIDAEMTLHDAAMHRFGQWWQRARRGGHAFAELAWRHGSAGDPQWRRQTASILVWGLLAVAGILALIVGSLLLNVALLAIGTGVLLLYALQVTRLTIKRMRGGEGPNRAFVIAFFLMLGKIPQLQGVFDYHRKRLTGGQSRLIEYKG